MVLTAVLFDLYGTLLCPTTRRGRIGAALVEALNSMGIGRVDEHPAGLERRIMTYPATLQDRDATPYESRLRSYAQAELGVTLDRQSLRKLADLACSELERRFAIDPTAIDVLARLSQSVHLALVTNFDHPPHILRVLKNYGLETIFSTVVISGSVGICKPDPAILRCARDRLGVAEPSRCAYVGDTVGDFDAANGDGMRFCWVRRRWPDEDRSRNPEVEKHRQDRARLTRLAATGQIAAIDSIRELQELVDVPW